MRKTWKKLCSVLLVALILSVCMAPAALAADYTATQNFISYLESKGIKYTYIGIQDNKEIVTVSYTLDNFDSLTCMLIFNDDSEEVSLRIWNIVTATAAKSRVLSVTNTLNAGYKFVKFVYDEDDSTVQAEMDMYIDGEHCGRSIYDSLLCMFRIVDDNEVAQQLKSLE